MASGVFKESFQIYRKEKLTKKKLKRLRKERKARFIDQKSKELQKETPASELWFYNKYNKEVIPRVVGNNPQSLFLDKTNAPFQGLWIPDIINEGYKYIIEVDGEIHNTQKQAYKDLNKDFGYRKRGYKVFRVKAYNDESYNQFVIDYKTYIEECHNSFLRGLFNRLQGVELDDLSNKQKTLMNQNHNRNYRGVELKDTVTLSAGIPEVKPKTILRKAGS
jgi:hypothetical protein